MGTTRAAGGGPLVEALAAAHGADAWRLALVAGADRPGAARAALQALVVAAVDGGAAAERPAILARARTWALESPGAGPIQGGNEPVASAFWSLPEGLRTALWCTEGLSLPTSDVERVLGAAGPASRSAAVARGRVRRSACRLRRAATDTTACGPTADVVSKVLAGHAPRTKAAMVEAHAAVCGACSDLLVALRRPTTAVQAGLPPPPDLVAGARRAWREHVGAPAHPLALHGRRAAAAVARRQRPVVAVLAVATAGSFGAGTSQLAALTEAPEPVVASVTAPVAPVRAVVAAPTPPTAVRRPQAVIPPLADHVTSDPGLALLVTPELAQVALPPPPPPPPPTIAPSVPPPPPALALMSEPLPAVDQARTLDVTLPLPMVPLSIELGPTCSTVTVGPLRLALPCQR